MSSLASTGDPFVHLHVASGYSLRHGASHPRTLVERAADHGMDTLALTDRDGSYGAVKFVLACRDAGIRPILGVDLAVQETGASTPTTGRRTPARGGAFLDESHPRVTLLAQDKRGWAALCRLISATHLAGERGKPLTTHALIAEHAREGGLFVLLGPASDLGRDLARRRPDLAKARLTRWRETVGESELLFELVCHRGPGEAAQAARALGFAREHDLPAVLANAVRYADRSDAPTADVLDSARRLVALDARHVDRVTGEAYLKSGKEMGEVAAELGLDASTARALLARTRQVADRCALDPRADLGIGEVHFPEFGTGLAEASYALRQRCEAGFGKRGVAVDNAYRTRLDDELALIETLGYPAYFLTVGDVVDLIKGMGVRAAARGSGAGSLVNFLIGVSDVDPLEHRLLMERFLSPLRTALPDIDVDVESARRMEVYERIFERFGADRTACVSMMDTYRVRHAVRDVGAALGMPPGEIDAIAKAFPHIRASQARQALRDLPELRASGLGDGKLDLLFRLVERLDGLPRHVALHPCGVLLSDATLLDRTPVEASWLGFPMSHFDKDDVEELGLLKLDVLGIRMQSAMAHAIAEVERVDGVRPDIDAAPRDDPETFALIQSTRTLGMFQIESPGQRELVGKFAPSSFADIIIDISLFRPGPVKSDMVVPFLEGRQGWRPVHCIHDDFAPFLDQTAGVVVFHEQVIELIATCTGCTLAEADEARRALGSEDGQADVRAWFLPAALRKGYGVDVVQQVWDVLVAFASFGFCKAHAAAFAVPTFQSAWLKTHHTAAFLAGVLTHDPGMYPKRLILDDARQFGIAVLPLDVNASDAVYRIEKLATYDEPPPAILGAPPEPGLPRVQGLGGENGSVDRHNPALGGAQRYGIRMSLADVKGISEAEVARIVAGRPYHSLSDFWHRAQPSRPVAEKLVLAGAFDSLYGIGAALPVRRRGQLTRRDLLLQLTELDTWSRGVARSARKLSVRDGAGALSRTDKSGKGVWELASAQSQAPAPVETEPAVQLALDLGDDPSEVQRSGLPEMTSAERVRAELDILGIDASEHVLAAYSSFLQTLGVTRSRDLIRCRSKAELLVAGVKVATQTPPIRSGRRVIFVTLDDATGPVDATFFEDAQVGYASTLFHSWLLVIRGVLRRTGPKGVSLRATGCWELPVLFDAWRHGGLDAVEALMAIKPVGFDVEVAPEPAVHGAAESRSSRPVMTKPGVGGTPLVYSSGFALSPYADIKPAGSRPGAPRKLWHSSPGSSGG